MMLTRRRVPMRLRIPAALASSVLLLGVLVPSGAWAADAEEPAPDAPAITTVNGKRFKMAKAAIARQLVRIADPSGDQVGPDGTSSADIADAHTDLAAAYVARAKLNPKLLTKMRKDFPPGTAGAFYGSDADWSKGDTLAFVAVELGAPRPDGGSQQVEVGFDGEAVVPVQPGTAGDPRSGVSRFSLSGLFADGSDASGTTDLAGWRPGSPIELYNARSGNMGYYDARTGTYYLIAPIPRDATSLAVTLRTQTDGGEIVDRLDLPAGGHFVDLADPAGGYDPGSEEPLLACRAVEVLEAAAAPTESAAQGDGGTDPELDGQQHLVTLTLGASDPESYRSQLEEPLEGIERLEVPVRGVGSEEEPTMVQAQVRLLPAMSAAVLSLPLPDGRWAIGALGDDAPRTPGGEPIVEVRSLTGAGGVAVGGGIDGIVAGDPSCGRWALSDHTCALGPQEAFAALVGLAPEGVTRSELTRPDGTRWCVGVDAATGGPKYVVGVGAADYRADDFARDVAAHRCPATPVDLGLEGVILDCGAENFESFFFRVAPEAAATADPGAGLLVSVDLVVDPGRAFGERYDGEVALGAMRELAAEVAATAIPARDAAGTLPGEATDDAADGPGGTDDPGTDGPGVTDDPAGVPDESGGETSPEG